MRARSVFKNGNGKQWILSLPDVKTAVQHGLPEGSNWKMLRRSYSDRLIWPSARIHLQSLRWTTNKPSITAPAALEVMWHLSVCLSDRINSYRYRYRHRHQNRNTQTYTHTNTYTQIARTRQDDANNTHWACITGCIRSFSSTQPS